jgi:raffinose/stachyose/melibiose transport system permease protein
MSVISQAARGAARVTGRSERGGAPGGPAHRGAGRRRRGPSAYIVLVALMALAVVMLLPFAIVAMNAVKSPVDFAQHGPVSLPRSVYLQGIGSFWTTEDFGRAIWNSFLISGSVAIAAVLLSVLNAYALGIGKIRGRRSIVAIFLVANFLPQESLVYPLYYLAKKTGLYDTQLSVIIVFTVIYAAFGTYLLSSVLSTFPREILEAASIDGAGRWRVLWRVVVPVSRPTIIVLMTFFFIWTWNEFFLPLVLLISNQNQTVPEALALLQGQHIMNPTTTSAAALLGILPAVLFFLVFQRTLTRGITVGAYR